MLHWLLHRWHGVISPLLLVAILLLLRMPIIKHHVALQLLLLLLLLPVEIPIHGLLLVGHLELIPHIHGHASPSSNSRWVHEIIAPHVHVHVHVTFSIHQHVVHVHAAGTTTMRLLLKTSSVSVPSYVGMAGYIGHLGHVNVVGRGMTRIAVGVGRLGRGGPLVGSHGNESRWLCLLR